MTSDLLINGTHYCFGVKLKFHSIPFRNKMEGYRTISWGIVHKPEAEERNKFLNGILKLIYSIDDIEYFYTIYQDNDQLMVKTYPSNNTTMSSSDGNGNFVFAGDERKETVIITKEMDK